MKNTRSRVAIGSVAFGAATDDMITEGILNDDPPSKRPEQVVEARKPLDLLKDDL
jgi:hypothetical protein